jgi:hypothetical protein
MFFMNKTPEVILTAGVSITNLQLPNYLPNFFFIASVSAGTIANRSPTTP